nr:hypothetical protein [Leuven Tombus-like virus 5]
MGRSTSTDEVSQDGVPGHRVASDDKPQARTAPQTSAGNGKTSDAQAPQTSASQPNPYQPTVEAIVPGVSVDRSNVLGSVRAYILSAKTSLQGVFSIRAEYDIAPGSKPVYDEVRRMVAMAPRDEATYSIARNAAIRACKEHNIDPECIPVVLAKALQVSRSEVNATVHLGRRKERKAANLLNSYYHVLRK